MPDLEEIKRFTETFDPHGDSFYPPDYIEWLIRVAERASDAPPGWRTEILDLLEQHRGETGADEDALEVLRRLSLFWSGRHPRRPCAPNGLQWTSVRPNVDGWYWTLRVGEEQADATPRWVEIRAGQTSVHDADTTLDPTEIGMWAGPILAPVLVWAHSR